MKLCNFYTHLFTFSISKDRDSINKEATPWVHGHRDLVQFRRFHKLVSFPDDIHALKARTERK